MAHRGTHAFVKVLRIGERIWARRVEWARFAGGTDAGTALRFAFAALRAAPDVIREGSTAPFRDALAGATCRFRVFGRELVLDGSSINGVREIGFRRVYFARPGFAPHTGWNVVDLGANAGVFTMIMALGGARVVAVEAQSGFIDEIRANAARNYVSDRVVAEHVLIGRSHGVFADESARLGATHFGEEPPTVTMQTLLDRNGIGRIDFLKVDIEGSEFGLLEEDTDWLDRVDRAVFEVHPAFGDVTRVATTLERHGLAVTSLDPDLKPSPLRPELDGYLYAVRAGLG